MASIEFADCPTRLDLSTSADTQEQAGSLRCTLRNISAKRQTVRIRIEPIGEAKPAWFALAGASSTSPLEIEQDIDAGGTLTVTAAVKVPPKSPPGAQTFRLRAISEAAPDTDFAEGPAIAFDVAAWKEPAADAPTGMPWWAVAVAVVMVLIVGGAIAYLVWPTPGLDGSRVMLANVQTGKCLTIEGGSAGNNVLAVQFDCDGDPLRRWLLKEVQPARFQISNGQTGKCLTIAGGVSTENNTDALQFNCDGDPSRTWTISDAPGDGTYQIVNVQTKKCLTIAGGRSTDNGVRALQYDCDSDPSRRWKLPRAG